MICRLHVKRWNIAVGGKTVLFQPGKHQRSEFELPLKTIWNLRETFLYKWTIGNSNVLMTRVDSLVLISFLPELFMIRYTSYLSMMIEVNTFFSVSIENSVCSFFAVLRLFCTTPLRSFYFESLTTASEISKYFSNCCSISSVGKFCKPTVFIRRFVCFDTIKQWEYSHFS